MTSSFQAVPARRGGRVIVHAIGELDGAAGRTLNDALAVLAKSSAAVVDMAAVTFVDKPLQLGARAVGMLGGEIMCGRVSPVEIARRGLQRHKLDRIDPEVRQVVKLRYHVRIFAALEWIILTARKIADVHFVNDQMRVFGQRHVIRSPDVFVHDLLAVL